MQEEDLLQLLGILLVLLEDLTHAQKPFHLPHVQICGLGVFLSFDARAATTRALSSMLYKLGGPYPCPEVLHLSLEQLCDLGLFITYAKRAPA